MLLCASPSVFNDGCVVAASASASAPTSPMVLLLDGYATMPEQNAVNRLDTMGG